MTNKEYILAVIDVLPDWEMWRWIKAMDKITAAIKENKMLEKIHAMQNLDKQKEEQAAQDAESLNQLDSMLNSL